MQRTALTKRLARVAAVVAVAGGLTMAAAPAQAGSTSYFHTGCDYSRADIYLNNGTLGRAIANHGWVNSGWSGWSFSHAWAWADAGYTCSNVWAATQRF